MVTTALVVDTPAAAAANPPITAYQHTYLALAAVAAVIAAFAFTLPDAQARAAATIPTTPTAPTASNRPTVGVRRGAGTG